MQPQGTGPMTAAASDDRPQLFFVLGTLLTFAVIAGFWVQYYGPLLAGSALTPRVAFWGIHLHSAIFLVWVAGFAYQAFLIRQSNAALHRRAGMFLSVFGFVAAAVGAWAGFAVVVRGVQDGMSLDRGASLLFLVIHDIAMFVGFLAFAIVYRRRREIHKRLMLFATLSLAFVGMGRLISRLAPDMYRERLWLFILIMLTPILAAMAHDLVKRRAIHSVYFIGLALFLLRLLRAPFVASEAWLSVGRAMLRPFL